MTKQYKNTKLTQSLIMLLKDHAFRFQTVM